MTSSARSNPQPQPIAEEAPEYGPLPPTADERREADKLSTDLLNARLLLHEHGYMVLAPERIVALLGASFYEGYAGSAPAPLVDGCGRDIDQRGRMAVR